MSTERIRLVLLVGEELRQALRLESAKTGVDMSDIVANLIEEQLSESVAEVRKRRSADEPRKPRGKKPAAD